MTGETDLDRLLAGLDPLLHDGVYVFVTLPRRETPPGLDPVLVFDEEEGRTLIVPRDRARETVDRLRTLTAWPPPAAPSSGIDGTRATSAHHPPPRVTSARGW